jgi:putative flippase GtrA
MLQGRAARIDTLLEKGRQNELFGQLVRFAVVGAACALIYSAVYLPIASWALPRRLAVLAVPPAFLVAVGVGYVLHSRWSFRGHGTREAGAARPLKFVGVQAAGMVLNLAYAWVLSGILAYPAWVPLLPAVFVTPLVTFAINRIWVFG